MAVAVLGLVLVAVKLLPLGHELIIKNELLAVSSTGTSTLVQNLLQFGLLRSYHATRP